MDHHAKKANYVLRSQQEWDRKLAFLELFQSNAGIPDEEILDNLGVFMSRQLLSRVLFMHHIYQKIIPVHGSILEFGTRYGQNLALFSNFRGIYEPFNHNRKIIGFDTFAGFEEIDKHDGQHPSIYKGAYNVSSNYEATLEKILAYHESESPLSHIKKYEIVKGDASQTVPQYLRDNQYTTIALAYFDMDVYKPTKDCIEAIRPHLVKGSVVGFDEANHPVFPGETIAIMETFGLNNIKLQRVPFNPTTSYFVVE